MIVETENEIYETKLNLIQIELTGYCNMKCKHCRAKNEPKVFFDKEKYNLIMELIKKESSNDFKLTLSGGEPFLHKDLLEYIKIAKDNGISSLVVTTNGSLVKDNYLEYINNLNFDNFIIQVSLDSLTEKIHDEFRGFTGAFKICDNLLDNIKNYPKINSSIRMTITEKTIYQMEEMVQYAINKGCKIIGFGSIIPFGKAEDCSMSLNKEIKLKFLTEVVRLNLKYRDKIEVVTEDPLKSNVKNSPWNICNNCSDDEMMFGGCTAGIDSLNIQSNGIITPCSMIKETILDLNECKTLDKVIEKYQNSQLVKKLFERNFSGKCGRCKKKYLCGGCRASAKGRTNDLFGPDESCWLNENNM